MSELQRAINAYKHWLDDGAFEEDFSRNRGLCDNFRIWVERKIGWYEGWQVYRELERLFNSERMNSYHPFNETMYVLFDEMKDYTCHLNRSRIKWVNDHYKVEQP